MTNGQVSAFVALLVLFSILTAAQVAMMINMTQPQPQQPQPERREQSVSIALMWRTPMMDGASPRQVLESTAKRMQYEQGTELGSDLNAQALVKVLEAIAILEGRETVTADGFPIIE
jgi:hypothetical protein